ncbi:hypothetical protein Adt_23267 [Abeliophyllum distichum]|uniref:Uncharacterized protein n=1 Tax=Abeliophyllum distichum TaxID=126358 RepID=A0ABD1SAF6_9LAMI
MEMKKLSPEKSHRKNYDCEFSRLSNRVRLTPPSLPHLGLGSTIAFSLYPGASLTLLSLSQLGRGFTTSFSLYPGASLALPSLSHYGTRLFRSSLFVSKSLIRAS